MMISLAAWKGGWILFFVLLLRGVASARDDDDRNDESEHNNNNNELDCRMRRLFMEKAKDAVPSRKNMTDVFEALELDRRCGDIVDDDSSAFVLPTTQQQHRDHHHRKDDNGPEAFDDTDDYNHDSTTTNRNRHHYFFVCPRKGKDDNVGNRTHPFFTIERALRATRAVMGAQNNNNNINNKHVSRGLADGGKETSFLPHPPYRRTVILEKGVHYLNETIVLTPEDSYLTIRSASNNETEMAWISGGILIRSETTEWKSMSSSDDNHKNSSGGSSMNHDKTARDGIWVANVSSLMPASKSSSSGAITGLFTLLSHERMTLARYPNANVEDWNNPQRYVPRKVGLEWTFPPFSEIPKFVSIDLSDPHNPTGHIKNDSAMSPYNSYGTGQGGACSTVWGDLPSYWCSNVSAGGWAFVDKAAALAGRSNIPVGMVLRYNDTDSSSESAIAQRIQKWSDPRGAIFHVSHTQGWAWHMFNVSGVVHNSINDNETTVRVNFASGGWQGGRNWQCKDKKGRLSDCNGEDKKLSGGDWYVEGVLDELDEPGEFFYNATTKLLYFYPINNDNNHDHNPHASSSRSDNNDHHHSTRGARRARRKLKQENHKMDSHNIPDLVATNLKTLIKVQGSKEHPVKGIELLNLGFRDAAKTYMEQWSAPSGGDWALHRGGAVHVDGAENVVVSQSLFRRLDGNAIMLSGYCRYANVADSEFSWIGNGAIATWGDTLNNGYDATGGIQPRYTTIERNVMSNLGLYQKQSSGWGQSKACRNVVRNNVMYNLPRAAINFNDGLGGGNLVEGNIIFNTCRESGDHGPINSWDRMPFLTDTTSEEDDDDSSSPSFRPMPTHTRNNLIIANYGASQGFDNDDGSSCYYTYNNVFYLADGFKMDYGGHDSRFFNNFVLGKQCYGTGSFLRGHADTFRNNTCIVGSGVAAGGKSTTTLDDDDNNHNNYGYGNYKDNDYDDENDDDPQEEKIAERNPEEVAHLFQCSITDGMIPNHNRYFTAEGNATWVCGGNDSLTLEEMQSMGYEIGSTAGIIPNNDTDAIMRWAQGVLLDEPSSVVEE